jgi:hypothetical protein
MYLELREEGAEPRRMSQANVRDQAVARRKESQSDVAPACLLALAEARHGNCSAARRSLATHKETTHE